jgi:hypothetical protein
METSNGLEPFCTAILTIAVIVRSRSARPPEQSCKPGTDTQICNGILNTAIPMMARTFELRRESNRLLISAILSELMPC